jgi:hypothetical protein
LVWVSLSRESSVNPSAAPLEVPSFMMLPMARMVSKMRCRASLDMTRSQTPASRSSLPLSSSDVTLNVSMVSSTLNLTVSRGTFLSSEKKSSAGSSSSGLPLKFAMAFCSMSVGRMEDRLFRRSPVILRSGSSVLNTFTRSPYENSLNAFSPMATLFARVRSIRPAIFFCGGRCWCWC